MAARHAARPLIAVWLGGCTVPPIIDGGLDLWCGESLCNWELEAGTVEPVPTWHPDDLGARMSGDPCTLSQTIDVAPYSEQCLQLTVVHKGNTSAPLSVTLDILDNGTADLVYPVPASAYDAHVAIFALPDWLDDTRLRIQKDGIAPATLGRIALETVDRTDCPSIDLPDRPYGAICSTGDQCAEQTCEVFEYATFGTVPVCGECTADKDCSDGLVCGAAVAPPPDRFVWPSCVTPASRAVGELCRADAECGTGVCCEAVCSECCGSQSCPGETACTIHGEGELLPRQCDAGRAAGATCFTAADCSSGECLGPELSICSVDGRTCESDADCMSETGCVAVGVRNGTCR